MTLSHLQSGALAVGVFSIVMVGFSLWTGAEAARRELNSISAHCQSLAKTGPQLFQCGQTSHQRAAATELKRKVADRSRIAKLETTND
jgi:hypothetical protein